METRRKKSAGSALERYLNWVKKDENFVKGLLVYSYIPAVPQLPEPSWAMPLAGADD